MSKPFQILAFVVFLLTSFCVNAQQDQGGIIVPNDSLKNHLPSERILYLPADGMVIYDAPNGNFIGKIKPGYPNNAPGIGSPIKGNDSLMIVHFCPFNSRPVLFEFENYFHSSDDCRHLIFTKFQDGFLQLDSNFWVSLNGLTESGFTVMNWMDFYVSLGRIIYALDPEKNPIRMSPYFDAEKIVTTNEDQFFIEISGESEGFFAPVKVTQYKINPCNDGGSTDSTNILNSYEGWIQIIDENGQPMVAHHSGGC